MGDVVQIRSGLCAQYEISRLQGRTYALAHYGDWALPQLRRALRDFSVPTGTMSIRDRAWHDAQAAVLRELIRGARLNNPAREESS